MKALGQSLRRLGLVCFAIGLASVPATAVGQCFLEDQLTASDAAPGDIYGTAVAVSGDVAVVGAPWDDDLGTQTGSVYVYRRQGGVWVEEQKLLPSSPTGGSWYLFGGPLTVAGDVIVVCAILDDTGAFNAGAVYVFRFDASLPPGQQWVEEQKITNPSPGQGDYFGFDVSVEGDVLVVGAVGDDATTVDSGSAYVYRYQPGTETWTFEQQLAPPSAIVKERFGQSTSLSGDVILVGAPHHDGAASAPTPLGPGAAYLFRYDASTAAWVAEQTLTPGTGAWGGFGFSVSLGGDVAMVAEPGLPTPGAGYGGAGSVHAFRYDAVGETWSPEQVLAPDPGALGDHFGYQVSLSGDTAVVGAPEGFMFSPTSSYATGSGRAHVWRFDGTDWIDETTLTASTGAFADQFGRAVSTDGDTFIVGALFHDAPYADAGAAYIYTPCGGFIRGDCNDDGSFDISDPIFLLTELFAAGPAGPCDDACDINDDGAKDIADGIFGLTALFVAGSPPPPLPHPDCGLDPTADALDCAAFASCP